MRVTAAKLKQLLGNFCANTNIHGFAYIAQPKRHLVERLFWLFSIATSLVLTGSLIHKLIIENQRNPTIIYTDQNVVHVTDILFPSVSIVPGLILKTPLKTGIDYESAKEEIKSGAVGLGNFSMNALKRLQIASLIARDGFMSNSIGNFSIPTDDFVERMRDDFPNMWLFNDNYEGLNVTIFFEGNWTERFSVNFTEVLCPTGFCYTFNFPKHTRRFLNLDV
jgi:hypothetical protein